MKKFEKLILEAESGISFELEETGETLTIRAVSSVRDVQEVHSDDYVANYEKPPIPSGYKYICGEWNSGYVIERVLDGSQFVWVPVGYLKSKETYCKNFFEKFGFDYADFSDKDLVDEQTERIKHYLGLSHDPVGEYLEEIESIDKYGGFYISRFNISEKNGMPQSVKGAKSWVNLKSRDAYKVAASFENSEEVKSNLTLDAEYGYICYWIILSGAKTVEEVTKDSSSWGNFKRGGTAETGSCEEWCANNIYDLAGNVSEFTFRSTGICSRGGNRYRCSGRKNIVSTSCGRDETNYTGFRIALCIK